MSEIYVEPQEMLAGADVYPRHWNRLVTNQKNMDARLTLIEGGEPPDPDYNDFPIGGIVAFTKPAAQIPSGWYVCDGNNGTPDLTGMFILGAAADGELEATGGASTHTHTNPTTGAAGGHSHSGSGTTGGPSANVNAAAGGGVSAASGSHTHGFSFSTGSAGGHGHTVGDTESGNNLPPYVKLYWIMRVS